MCLEKAAQRGIRRQWPQLGPLVAERDQIVVMELEGPTLVRRVLRQQGLAHRIAHRRLLSGVRAHLDDGVEAADAFAELARKTEKLSLEKQLERYRHDLDPISDYAPVEWITQKPYRIYRARKNEADLFVKTWPERSLGERRKATAPLLEFFGKAD